jgi:hypothetical protein
MPEPPDENRQRGHGRGCFRSLIFSRPVGVSASPSMDQSAKENGMEFQKGYAPVDGLSMYYEIHGSAHTDCPPLVLLHGGGDTIQTSFGKLLPELARNRFGRLNQASQPFT